MDIFLGFIFGGLFYGYIIFMLVFPAGAIRKEWVYTIPIWPLALLVLLICVILRGLEVLLEAMGF